MMFSFCKYGTAQSSFWHLFCFAGGRSSQCEPQIEAEPSEPRHRSVCRHTDRPLKECSHLAATYHIPAAQSQVCCMWRLDWRRLSYVFWERAWVWFIFRSYLDGWLCYLQVFTVFKLWCNRRINCVSA
jgi:hypothetical protein